MKNLLFLLLLNAGLFNATAQIPNNGMEEWTNAPQLVDWITNSYPLTLPPYDPYIVRQDTESHGGTYAANFWGNGIIKPTATAIFAVGPTHPQQLDFWYKLAFAPCVNEVGYPQMDTASVDVQLLLNGTLVDQGHWESTTSQLNYSLQSVVISQNALAFDSCRITIRGGKVMGGCGITIASTEFKVDDLTLVDAGQDCVDPDQIDPTAFCIDVYDPVCGCNGVTYSNSCAAEFYGGVTSWTAGECGVCSASFTQTQNQLQAFFTNQSTAASITGYSWDFGDNQTSTDETPNHTFNQIGWYEVCLTVLGQNASGAPCSNQFCDSIYIHDGCIDSSLICIPGSLCCDAPINNPVCGCDGLTYINPCVATFLGGVLSMTDGECGSVGLGNFIPEVAVRLSPNPAQDEIVLLLSDQIKANSKVVIVNVHGQELVQKPKDLHQSQMRIPVSHLPSGLYLLRVVNQGQIDSVVKWIKE